MVYFTPLTSLYSNIFIQITKQNIIDSFLTTQRMIVHSHKLFYVITLSLSVMSVQQAGKHCLLSLLLLFHHPITTDFRFRSFLFYLRGLTWQSYQWSNPFVEIATKLNAILPPTAALPCPH
uniref:Uncharacterized protein n=1 Tax=Rhipicephalus microplus TaxID=6941 RepID=A0A6G5AHD5_RHIMP